MGHLQNLMTWAKAQGVAINGIQPSKIPGRGTGILATRKIKVPLRKRISDGVCLCLFAPGGD
jgi:hypothetical protein